MHENSNKLTKAFHFLPALFVYLMAGNITYCFTYYFFTTDTIKLGISIFFYCLLVLTLYSHTLTMVTNPGEVAESWINIGKSIEFNKNQNYCKKCERRRPDRSHHCKTCNKCILKMDHHCRWVFNCIGFYNQKFFYQFLFYASLTSIVSAFSLLYEVFNIDFIIISQYQQDDNHEGLVKYLAEPFYLIFTCFMAFTLSISISILFVFQTKLISSNLTTIEYRTYETNEDNPYFDENRMDSFRIVMGSSFISWFACWFVPNEYNNGYSFSKNIHSRHEFENRLSKANNGYDVIEQSFNRGSSDNTDLSDDGKSSRFSVSSRRKEEQRELKADEN